MILIDSYEENKTPNHVNLPISLGRFPSKTLTDDNNAAKNIIVEYFSNDEKVANA